MHDVLPVAWAFSTRPSVAISGHQWSSVVISGTRRMGILDAAGREVARLLRHQERHQERPGAELALAHRLRSERAAEEGASAASRRHAEADQRRFSGHGAPAREAA